MPDEKSIMDKALEMFMWQPAAKESASFSRFDFTFYDNNALGFALDGARLTRFFSRASVKDGRVIDTKTAKKTAWIVGENTLDVRYEEKKLTLLQHIEVPEGAPYFIISATLSDKKGETETNFIVPMEFAYPSQQDDALFLSLDQKMLLVPYDNDMWVRYESAPLRPGRTSYELSAIYNDTTLRGMIVGALDYDTWKNAIKCSDHDARVYYAFSGVADDGTHDIYPHGMLSGEKVQSARFLCGFWDDIRDGLEAFGEISMEGKYRMGWSGPAPFGWNSYSAGCMTLEQWEAAAKFIREELPNFHDANGAASINLDANFLLNKNKMRKLVDDFHARGQKAGNYLAPALAIEGLSKFIPLKGALGSLEDCIMRRPDGSLYPKIDGGRPTDVTLPKFEKNLRASIRELVEMGFDYIKVDFTSHAGVEGARYDKSVKTGRQALTRFYRIMAEELDPQKIGREIFLDFSISPLFPGGYATGRRACCDAFGKQEDVRYVLNALTYGWWQSSSAGQSLYYFNDPDHTVLSCSRVDGRGYTEEAEAHSRYNASVISGTVLLLSDNFGGGGAEEDIRRARERAPMFANNEKLNALARVGKPFRPVYLCGDASPAYYLWHEGRCFLALFNLEGEEREIRVPASAFGAKESGLARGIDREFEFAYQNEIQLKLGAYDSAIMELL